MGRQISTLTRALTRCKKQKIATVYSGICCNPFCKKVFWTHINPRWNITRPGLGTRCSKFCGRANGYRKDSDGYMSRSIKGKNIYEHRAVMETILGRRLHRFETVHHKNGNKTDNRPENLELWTTYQPHGQRVCDLVAFVNKYYNNWSEKK